MMTDEIVNQLKYKNDIRKAIAIGATSPKQLFEPNDLLSYRFAFNTEHENNHVPVYLQNPERAIQEKAMNKLCCNGFALSCFDTESNAQETFFKFSRSSKNFSRTAGNCLCHGILGNSDGLKTETNSSSGHFGFYEFEECDLNLTFDILKQLI